MTSVAPPLPDIVPVGISDTSPAFDGSTPGAAASPTLPLPPPITASPTLPLPPPITASPTLPLPPPIIFPPGLRIIRGGSWLINYQPSGFFSVAYDGTLRIENTSTGRRASGDLYQRPVITFPGPFGPPTTIPLPPPSPANGIPIQNRTRYRYYLRVTKIDPLFSFGTTFDLGFQMFRYQGTSKTSFTFTKDASDYNVRMTWMVAPGTLYPSPRDYAEGDVKSDATGAIVGRLKMGWVSEFYRKCTVEIDTVSGSERPLNNGAGEDWPTVYKNVGLDLSIKLSDTDVTEPSGDSWSDAELHNAMLAKRDPTNLDTEWHYYILIVKLLDEPAFGIMFDWSSTDSNNTAREGVAVGSNTLTPSTTDWGTEGGKRFGLAKSAFLRTAMHELGHAFGLQHNVSETDNSFMNRTITIVSKGTAANPFPNNIKWNYADENLLQLRHWPDVFVRPGGVEFASATNTTPPIAQDETVELEDLELEVKPLLGEVPLGAPVRVEIKLTNNGKTPVLVPSSLSLKAGYVSGTVTDTSGTARSFKPFICYDMQQPLKSIEPKDSVSTSLTLLRGGQGALFPTGGIAEIKVNIGWNISEGTAGSVTGSTTVLITPPIEKSHAAAAHKLLTTPDAHLILILGGDHLKDGIDAVHHALKDKTLRPHYACIEARRRSQKFFGRAADPDSASELLHGHGDVVMSHTERSKLKKLGVKC